ncbi:elongation factor 4 [Candidatus Kaiserbacteria bacterium RIFCSPHIGHO2_01_FULL_46_22]|uniref:Elongation factor 4 n=1 Tax=Candidatus Kaiserbacteria bacterium RIFCSPHIGHO2_01_FULL_46_22 TaxID=1798475 RepID=A0A1F6BXQ8_9BACT|nr:MAG: elongation factor 4 [Candidatus Kaiserbacteria bacterium RIFCSPHIGHO2_01_FULL_46_22]
MEIRNFGIIAHIDHGKSTLADRMLEVTKTVETRKMKDQVLDSMELERERGITIKMQPVRMNHSYEGTEYVLNLIDTPGHIDFSYEVSRALRAIEGVLLLVDSTQGVQAQTLTTLQMAKDLGLVIIPVLTKIDVPHSRVKEVGEELCKLLGCDESDIICVSGKTGEGVSALLDAICVRIPPPRASEAGVNRGLIFDFQYSNHRGIIIYLRVFDGTLKKGDALRFVVGKRNFTALEVGVLVPQELPTNSLEAGEIGYIVTGIKEAGIANVGDTITLEKGNAEAIAGYSEPQPVVWASVFPDSQDDFTILRQALDRLRLSDSSLSYEEESSGVLGRGFRCGFLGMLHMEIVTERLRREFDIEIIITSPSISYEITSPSGEIQNVYAASRFPDYGANVTVREPWILGQIITPGDFMGNILTLLYEHESSVIDTEVFGDGRTLLTIEMPLRELMRGFFDRLKNSSSGYASLSYEIAEMRPADVARLDIYVAEELVPAFSRVIGTRRIEIDARALVEKLYKTLPRQQFVTKIQTKALGRFIASKTLSAMGKDVTAHLYGGDVSRKNKLLDKQKKGKKKMLERGRVQIPQEVFMKMIKED